MTILQDAQKYPPIVTFNEDLDTLLGGGVHIGRITEFYGGPGIGKTQLGYVKIETHHFDLLELNSASILTYPKILEELMGEVSTLTLKAAL